MSGPESEYPTSQVTEDWLSSLPDELLHLVMSSLPAWQAVQLCVLSRRWKTLWTTMPNLNINLSNLWNKQEHNSHTSTTRISKFVNTLLCRHESPFDLHTFRLFCNLYKIMGGYWLGKSVRSWIRYAVKHNVRVLIIDIGGNGEIILPSDTFTTSSLEHVKFSYWGPVDTPEIINLPKLKEFRLNFATVNQDFVTKLLGGCPVLKDLHMNSRFTGISNIISHSLKHLRIITDHKDGSIELIDCPNLLTFHLGICSCNLKKYEIILNTPSLSKACIEICRCAAFDSPKCVIQSNILCGLFNVNSLDLRCTSLMKHFLRGEVPSCKTFSKMTCLSVDKICLACCFNVLRSFLEHCPNLKKLSLVQCYLCTCKKQLMWSKQDKEAKFPCEQLQTVVLKFLFDDNAFQMVLKRLQEVVTGSCNVRTMRIKLP